MIEEISVKDLGEIKEEYRIIGGLVEILEREVELRSERRVNAHAVAVHRAYVAEPAVIRFIGDRKIAGKERRLRRADVHAGDEELFPFAVLVDVKVILLRLEAVAHAELGVLILII